MEEGSNNKVNNNDLDNSYEYRSRSIYERRLIAEEELPRLVALATRVDENANYNNGIIWGCSEIVPDCDDFEWSYSQRAAARNLGRRKLHNNFVPDVIIGDHHRFAYYYMKVHIKQYEDRLKILIAKRDIFLQFIKDNIEVCNIFADCNVLKCVYKDDIDRALKSLKNAKKQHPSKEKYATAAIHYLEIITELQAINKKLDIFKRLVNIDFIEYRKLIRRIVLMMKFKIGCGYGFSFGNHIGHFLLHKINDNAGMSKMLKMIDPDYNYYKLVWSKSYVYWHCRYRFIPNHVFQLGSIKYCYANNIDINSFKEHAMPVTAIANYITKKDNLAKIKYIRTADEKLQYYRTGSGRVRK